ncbi:unnamed protein product [Heterobilharzia americana]|nr:unnamed protein product [Heterobilharzia americana]
MKIFSAGTLSPGVLRSVFIERCPRFGGFRQHDSHEFIRAILDCMKQEELIRWKKGILLKLNVNPKDICDDERQSVRSWGKAASTATIIDRLFGGVLLVHWNPFLDLSLPVLDMNVSKHKENGPTGKQHSRGMNNSKQRRKKERKHKTQKQRKRQTFTDDKQTGDNYLSQCSSESESHETSLNQTEEVTSYPLCTLSSSECETDEQIDKLTSRNDPDRFNEIVNGSECDEIVSSDGNCADVEGSDRHDSVTSLQLIVNNDNGNPDRIEEIDPNRSYILTEEFDKLHFNSSTSSQLLFDTDELTQAIHYSRIPLNHQYNHMNLEENSTSLYDCLSKYTAAELLTGCNQLVCDVCSSKKSTESETRNDNKNTLNNNNNPPVLQDVIKRDLIYKPPPILMIHLKRFQQVGIHLRKSQKRINFPIYLDLSPFCSVLVVSHSSQIRYRLYGVIEHTGHLTSGHYVAYIAVQKLNGIINTLENQSNLLLNRFIGPLNRSPKWPLSVQDLVQRLRRCDHHRLLLAANNLTSSKLLLFSQLQNNSSPINNSIHSDKKDSCNALNHEVDVNDSRSWYYCSDNHVSHVSEATVLNCQPYLLFYERIE